MERLVLLAIPYTHCGPSELVECLSCPNVPVRSLKQGSPQADIEAEMVGVVWAEFMTTSTDFLPTSKLN